jgi:drug/metabolite transporter (DMT)-like permease
MNILAVTLGFVWSLVFFAESHSLFVWIAMALMLSGVLLITLQPGRGGRA